MKYYPLWSFRSASLKFKSSVHQPPRLCLKLHSCRTGAITHCAVLLSTLPPPCLAYNGLWFLVPWYTSQRDYSLSSLSPLYSLFILFSQPEKSPIFLLSIKMLHCLTNAKLSINIWLDVSRNIPLYLAYII